MNFSEIKSLDDEYIMHTYGRNKLAIVSGKGATVFDSEGKSYIDFTSGIGVSSIGYGNEAWARAVYEQASKLAHISNLYYTEPCARLAKYLCARSGMSRVFFGNSGAEGNEGMIKLARKYSYDKYGEGRSRVVTLKQSFHGRTITTLKATGQDHFHEFFYPFTEGFSYVTAGDFDELRQELEKDDVCAVMVELIQGEGGVFVLDENYVRQVRLLCDELDILLLVDEVQTGIGRTGNLFAYQGYGIKPDAVSFAKGIAGGLPMGGFMSGDKCKDVLGPGTHGSTFGGNPVSAAAAICVLDIVDDKLISEVVEKGDYIKTKIAGFGSPKVKDIRGKGLMIGIELEWVQNSDISKQAIEEGLLTLTAGSNVLRLLPPLTISYEEMDRGLKILEKVLM